MEDLMLEIDLEICIELNEVRKTGLVKEEIQLKGSTLRNKDMNLRKHRTC